MDSNSESLQSSSGGDEEYDSRAAMMNPPPRPQPHHLYHHHQQQHQQNTQLASSMFDPSLPGYSFPNQNPLLNLDMLIWSKTLRSDPNCTDPPNILPSSSSPPIQTRTTGFRNSSPSSSAVQFPPMMPETAFRPSAAAAAASSSSEQTSTTTGLGSVVRNSKKRSRASRRAPTTVLTTDTTNFRAMVQEFTGIPAPPFTTSSSPFPRTRLDLFSSSSSPSLKSAHFFDSCSNIPQSPPYLLRPFAQKIQPPPPPQLQPLPFVSSSNHNNNNNNNNTSAAISTNMTSNNSTSINYQLSPVVANSDLVGQVNMHNNNPAMLSFQSLLQSSSPKYPLPNSNINLGSRLSNDHEFGLAHGHLNPHGHLITSVSSMEGTERRRRSNIVSHNNNPPNWGGDGVLGSNDNHDVGDQTTIMLRSVNDNYGNLQQQQQQQRDANGKASYLASSTSSFHGDRGGTSENNISTRTEGS